MLPPLRTQMNRCVKCWTEFEKDYKANVCEGCTNVVPGFPMFVLETRTLGKGHYARKITRFEEAEIKKGVGVPIGNGKFALGRKEGGKIQEKPPRN